MTVVDYPRVVVRNASFENGHVSGSLGLGLVASATPTADPVLSFNSKSFGTLLPKHVAEQHSLLLNNEDFAQRGSYLQAHNISFVRIRSPNKVFYSTSLEVAGAASATGFEYGELHNVTVDGRGTAAPVAGVLFTNVSYVWTHNSTFVGLRHDAHSAGVMSVRAVEVLVSHSSFRDHELLTYPNPTAPGTAITVVGRESSSQNTGSTPRVRIESCEVRGCFSENGAVLLRWVEDVEVLNSTFVNNTAMDGFGTGLECNTGQRVRVRNCTF